MKLFRMKNMGTRLIFIVVFILCVAFGKAQDNSGCLTKHQLFKMQSSSLDDIRMFLNNEGWSFDGAKSNQSYNYFDYPINYDIVLWEKSSYYNGGNIFLYTSAGKPNIVIYQSNSSCFNNLLQSFNTNKGKTNIDNDKLVTTFKEANITSEFREYKNDYSSRQLSILVYNSTALNQEIRILKEQDESIKKAQLNTKKQEVTDIIDLPEEIDGKGSMVEPPAQIFTIVEPPAQIFTIVEHTAQIFTIVEHMPEFPEGEEGLFKYLSKIIKYPSMAKDNGISGTVYVTFVVEGNGQITDVKKLRGIGGGCDEEAIRVVKSMPSWKPGKQNGKAVRVQYNLPIKFTLR